ncbi:hypothetical protein SAMN06296386_10277 [Lachnospiraceae bacterium]|nr:hypothetical protein SAMN06296386_10277 [Lachnospiraceae bacterium]
MEYTPVDNNPINNIVFTPGAHVRFKDEKDKMVGGKIVKEYPFIVTVQADTLHGKVYGVSKNSFVCGDAKFE